MGSQRKEAAPPRTPTSPPPRTRLPSTTASRWPKSRKVEGDSNLYDLRLGQRRSPMWSFVKSRSAFGSCQTRYNMSLNSVCLLFFQSSPINLFPWGSLFFPWQISNKDAVQLRIIIIIISCTSFITIYNLVEPGGDQQETLPASRPQVTRQLHHQAGCQPHPGGSYHKVCFNVVTV